MNLESKLSKVKFVSFTDEKELQSEVESYLKRLGLKYEREVRLNSRDRIDFLIDSVGIEIKIKGSSVHVLKQMSRYAESNRIEKLILLTTNPHGFPKELNSKPVTIVRLGSAWL
jgi:hypothetical protein